MKLVSVSTRNSDGDVFRSSPMDDWIIIQWVTRAKKEYAYMYSYHIETEDGEIYNGE